MTFGFEATFSIENWWQEPGFCSTWETPEKIARMKHCGESLASLLGGTCRETRDTYQAIQYEVYLADGTKSFEVTSEPGTVEIKTPPTLFADLKSSLEPLFEATQQAGFVPYRTWWYGPKSGTQGGCHVNLGGFTHETNPLYLDPLLVLKYVAYFHNRPALHYPFMGPDVGQGGNCMRMDEQIQSPVVPVQKFIEQVNHGITLEPDDLIRHLGETSLYTVKHSAPTLRKYQNPLYLLEDRAMESLRSPEEFELVALLRLKQLELLKETPRIENLADFGDGLHKDYLCSAYLKLKLADICQELGMSFAPFRVFFERQWPELSYGDYTPKNLRVREGRRERKIDGVHEAKGNLILSKKIDTRYRRFEIAVPRDSVHEQKTGQPRFEINGFTIYPRKIGDEWVALVDIFANQKDSLLCIKWGNEITWLHIPDMRFSSEGPRFETRRSDLVPEFYRSFEEVSDFFF